MKRTYTRPSLQSYGTVLSLTLGSSGTAPDFINHVAVNNCTLPAGTTHGECDFFS